MRSFEGTVIMEEALKETLEKDLDVPHTIELTVARTQPEASPIARIGIERISRKTDLIPPEKMKRILLESAKVRILNESRTLACSSCYEYAVIRRVKDMPTDFTCPKCHSSLGITTETPEFFDAIAKRKARNLSQFEGEILSEAKATAGLLKKYGKVAAYVLGGRRIRSEEAEPCSVGQARSPIDFTKRSWGQRGGSFGVASGEIQISSRSSGRTIS